MAEKSAVVNLSFGCFSLFHVALRQEKQQLEADVADAKRSSLKLREKLTDVRASNDAMHKRIMTLLGQTSTSPVVSSSAGGDCANHLSTNDAPDDHQQVSSSPVLYYHHHQVDYANEVGTPAQSWS